MSVNYKYFFNIFLCKDVSDLKARLSFIALETIVSESYYEVGDSWIEDEKLKKRVLEQILLLQKDLIEQYGYLIHSINQCGDITRDMRYPDVGLGQWVVTCLIDFLETKERLVKAQEIYDNYPEEDEETGKQTHPYSDAYIKAWLKKKFVQSKYIRDQ